MDVFLTAIIPLIALISGAVKSKRAENANDLFSKDYTSVLKGICCIVVVMVHIGPNYANFLQDAISSFGYICVTLFFMFSAYGMQLSVEYKKNYLNNF